jgi:exodeoxyribonuclease VII small subunit
MVSEKNDAPLEKKSFEASFEQLQQVVKRLESGELTLEAALAHFEEGVRLTRTCQETLQAAEQRVEVLMRTPQAPVSSSVGPASSSDDREQEASYCLKPFPSSQPVGHS